MPHSVSLVPLNRALSKLGILSRSQATSAIRAGRVAVDGRIVTDPAAAIIPERARIQVDGSPAVPAGWRTILFHKPKGVVTTRRDPDGRKTVYDVLGRAGRGLVPVGRLDLATSGLLLLTTDTRLADWILDPANAVPRVYVATVRGRLTEAALQAITSTGVSSRGERLRARAAALRRASGRESHVTIELREGKNREIRRIFAALGHEVTRLKRVSFGGLELGDLAPGEWRELTRDEVRAAFAAARR